MSGDKDSDYKEMIKQLIEGGLKKRGGPKALAQAIGVNPSFVSQVLQRDKHFSQEHVHKIADFFSLGPAETNILLLVHQRDRAGSVGLRRHYEELLQKSRQEQMTVSSRVAPTKKIGPECQARYYGDWTYSAIRLLCTTKKFNTPQEIAHRLSLSQGAVNKALKFLQENGLVEPDEKGRIRSSGSVHIDHASPFVQNHHRNWRLKAMNGHSSLSENELAFTAPVTLSRRDFEAIKKEILKLIGSVSDQVRKGPSEDLACLTIDWFWPR